ADGAVEYPEDCQRANQPQAAVARQAEVVVKLEDEGDEILPREAAGTPLPLAQHRGGVWLKVEHPWWQIVVLAGGRIVARHGGQQRRVSPLVRLLQVPDQALRLGGLQAFD